MEGLQMMQPLFRYPARAEIRGNLLINQAKRGIIYSKGQAYMSAEELIEVWKETAEKHGYILNNRKAGYIEKGAAICVKVLNGACICKPQERPMCPCNEMHEDIKKTGCCYCKIFYDPNWQGEYGVAR